MEVETAEFLLGILNAQQLAASSPDFEELARKLMQARRELQAIIDGDETTAKATAKEPR